MNALLRYILYLINETRIKLKCLLFYNAEMSINQLLRVPIVIFTIAMQMSLVFTTYPRVLLQGQYHTYVYLKLHGAIVLQLCSAGNHQQCFSLIPNQHQQLATSQQYFSLTANQHQSLATVSRIKCMQMSSCCFFYGDELLTDAMLFYLKLMLAYAHSI